MSIVPEILERISNREWYHQRFDGSPLFISAIAEAEIKKEERKPIGTEADVRVCFFEDGKADWYLDIKDVERGANAVIELARKDSNISKSLLGAWKRDEDKFDYFFSHEFPRVHLDSLSRDELMALWYRYWTLFQNRTTSSSVIDHFALGTDEYISDLLRKEIGKVERESEFTTIFSTATAPIHQSFINSAEIELLRIATEESDETLREYAKRFYWTMNNYVLAQVLDEDHFKDELNTWHESGKKLKKELKSIKDTPQKNKKDKEALLKRYQFSELLKNLLKISEDFTWWQDERKRATYLNIDMGSKILHEISNRTGYTMEELKYTSTPELTEILMHGKPPLDELKQRRKKCVFIWTRDAVVVRCGPEVDVLKKQMLGDLSQDEIQDLRGLAASTGKAIGPARIVKSATEIDKVKQGDVLIAVMTRPDYVPAMKKAAAIVTNEGGITCHAAIVSRELGIPCLIGTKIATEVFKDGEMVEVSANHGWVRKINI